MNKEESDDGGEHTNESYHPPPKPKKTRKPSPKKAKVKKMGPVYIITDYDEWERLLKEGPLQSGEIRFYKGPSRPVNF